MKVHHIIFTCSETINQHNMSKNILAAHSIGVEGHIIVLLNFCYHKLSYYTDKAVNITIH